MDPENHVPGLEVAKAFMLMPPMFVGFFTGFALTQPRPPAVVLVVVVLILAGLHLGVCGALAWICRHGGRCLGHSWIVWIVMSAIAYLLGLGANFLPD